MQVLALVLVLVLVLGQVQAQAQVQAQVLILAQGQVHAQVVGLTCLPCHCLTRVVHPSSQCSFQHGCQGGNRCCPRSKSKPRPRFALTCMLNRNADICVGLAVAVAVALSRIVHRRRVPPVYVVACACMLTLLSL